MVASSTQFLNGQAKTLHYTCSCNTPLTWQTLYFCLCFLPAFFTPRFLLTPFCSSVVTLCVHVCLCPFEFTWLLLYFVDTFVSCAFVVFSCYFVFCHAENTYWVPVLFCINYNSQSPLLPLTVSHVHLHHISFHSTLCLAF